MNREIPSTFGEMLQRFRKRSRLTQQQLATTLGVHYNTIGGWERGDGLPEKKGIVLELAKRLHLNDQESRQFLEASLTALAPHWSVPVRRNPFFTGRAQVLEALHTRLGPDQIVAPTQSYAIHGLAGIGKTQLAIEYAYRYALEYTAVFWIAAESVENVLACFLAIAEQLQLPERLDADQQRMVTAVQRWLNRHGNWLLIWDNLEEVKLLQRYLSPASQGAVLITTRRQALGTLAQDLELPTMTQEEGMLLLLRRAKVLAPEATKEQVDHLAVSRPSEHLATQEVVITLGGLPLALDQAGAYIEATRCSLSDYLHLLQSFPLHLLDERDADVDYPLSVTRTFTLAFERLERNNPSAAEVLTVCAFLSPEAIPETFFLAGAPHLGAAVEALVADPFAFHAALKALLTYSLILRDATTHTLTIHRLVQTVLKGRLSQATWRTWAERVIKAMTHLFPIDEEHTDYWQVCERLLPHAFVCLTLAEQWSEDKALRITLLSRVADYLFKRVRYIEAKPLFERAGSLGEEELGPKHPLVAAAHDGLGRLYVMQGQYELAEPLLQRALHILEQALGPEHLQVVQSLNHLSQLYIVQGQYELAEPLLQRALHILEQALGPEHPQIARSLNYLGSVYIEQGKYEQAEPLYQQALSILQQTLGPEHPTVAYLLNNLAAIAYEQGKYEQAEPLYQQALSIWEQALGPEHPTVADPLNGLATLYTKQRRYAEAEPLFQRALALRQQHLGPQHPETAQTLHDLALFHQRQGNKGEAVSLAERALQIRSQSLSDTHPKTIITRTLYTQLVQEHVHIEETQSVEWETEESAISPQATVASSPSAKDPLQEFLSACCYLHPHAWSRSADLWSTYQQWVRESGERYTLSQRRFLAALKAQGCQPARTNTSRIWRGIALK